MEIESICLPSSYHSWGCHGFWCPSSLHRAGPRTSTPLGSGRTALSCSSRPHRSWECTSLQIQTRSHFLNIDTLSTHTAAWYWCWKWVQQTRMPARFSEPVIRPSVRIERQLFGRECHGDSENFPCLFYTNTHMFGGYDLVMWCVSFYCQSGI